MDQESTVIESSGADIASKDNSNSMEMDTDPGVQAEPIEHKEKLHEENKPPRAMMHSGDGINIFDSLMEQTPSTSKSLNPRSKRRNRSFTEIEVSQRILLPRSSKTRAYESLRNIGKLGTLSKSTLSRSVSMKRKRKVKQLNYERRQPSYKRRGRTTGNSRRMVGRTCLHGCRCAIHGKGRHRANKKESMMSMGSATTSETPTSESTQSEDCCRCYHHKH